jgi:hypothetical protein
MWLQMLKEKLQKLSSYKKLLVKIHFLDFVFLLLISGLYAV